jgi:hypothetical protein
MDKEATATIISVIIFTFLMLFIMSPIKYNYMRLELAEKCSFCDPDAIPQLGNTWLVGDFITVGMSVILTACMFQIKKKAAKA